MKSTNAFTTTRSLKEPVVSKPRTVVSAGLVDSTYRKLREMAITLSLQPGERLNDAILAKELGVSSTPLRCAKNRLLIEGLLTFSADQGYCRKPLDAQEVYDLYEFRQNMEMRAVRLVVERATDKQLLELERFTQESAKGNIEFKLDKVISLDEEFHERLISLTGNVEMGNSLRNINERIRCVRWIRMNSDSSEIQTPHTEIVRMLRERNAEEGMRLMGEHIGHKFSQIIDKIEECYRQIGLSTGGQIQQGQTCGLKPKQRRRILVKPVGTGNEQLDSSLVPFGEAFLKNLPNSLSASEASPVLFGLLESSGPRLIA